eukprot:TRINITY_DN17535_c0_g1_i3.p1 TRINITY_DN17535_c0_g1~~TRINITY_DN17535_c0_g1_i3.p1  ORF type:complete len:435 (-),score=109.89 TRINITY_DN17535_c0_g1_i3:110-1414(-)
MWSRRESSDSGHSFYQQHLQTSGSLDIFGVDSDNDGLQVTKQDTLDEQDPRKKLQNAEKQVAALERVVEELKAMLKATASKGAQLASRNEALMGEIERVKADTGRIQRGEAPTPTSRSPSPCPPQPPWSQFQAGGDRGIRASVIKKAFAAARRSSPLPGAQGGGGRAPTISIFNPRQTMEMRLTIGRTGALREARESSSSESSPRPPSSMPGGRRLSSIPSARSSFSHESDADQARADAEMREHLFLEEAVSRLERENFNMRKAGVSMNGVDAEIAGLGLDVHELHSCYRADEEMCEYNAVADKCAEVSESVWLLQSEMAAHNDSRPVFNEARQEVLEANEALRAKCQELEVTERGLPAELRESIMHLHEEENDAMLMQEEVEGLEKLYQERQDTEVLQESRRELQNRECRSSPRTWGRSAPHSEFCMWSSSGP